METFDIRHGNTSRCVYGANTRLEERADLFRDLTYRPSRKTTNYSELDMRSYVPSEVAKQVPCRGQTFVESCKDLGRRISLRSSPAISELSLYGWDTHSGQVGDRDPLAGSFANLARGIQSLSYATGDTWKDTAIIVLTEFGRAVAPNRMLGTDHGTGSVCLVISSSVPGGRVVGPSVGSRFRDNLDGANVRVGVDTRNVICEVLKAHFSLPEEVVSGEILLA
jgi:uncharacterized protein (DUF1501 family)